MEKNTIEDFLGLTNELLQKKVSQCIENVPTFPGTGYLRERLKFFKVEPWPMVIFLVYNHQDALTRMLDVYANYQGNEAKEVIIESLREYYVIGKVIEIMVKQNPALNPFRQD